MPQTAAVIWADGPSSMPSEPSKADIRAWGAWLESIANAFSAGGGLIYSSRASLYADLAHAANMSAWVLGDTTVGNNGIYQKVGASGSGSWGRLGDLPYSFNLATDVGAGTANAIQATTPFPVSSSQLIVLNIATTTTASPATVSFNSGAALTIKAASGQDAVPGLTAGMLIAGFISGSTFRMITDQASAAIQAAAAASAAAANGSALAAAASVSLYVFPTRATAIAANVPTTMKFLRTAGYASIGDGGAALYKWVAAQPAHPGKFQSNDGAWWELVVEHGIDIRQMGAKVDNVTDDSAAILNSLAVLTAVGTTGGILILPPGRIAIASTINYVFPNREFVLNIRGAGSVATALNVTGNVDGLYFTRTHADNSIRASGFSVLSNFAGTHNGMTLYSATYLDHNSSWSLLLDIVLAGNDAGAVFYWAINLLGDGWSAVYVEQCSFNSKTSGAGQGAVVQGRAGSPNLYCVLWNFQSCFFNYLDKGFIYGNYVQGITINQCNINGRVGSAGIFAASGLTDTSQINITNCQIDTGGNCIDLNSAVLGTIIVGNTISQSGAGSVAVNLPVCFFAQIEGNFIAAYGSPASSYGVVIGPPGSAIVTGNIFKDLTNGVLANASTSEVKVYGNIYHSVSSPTTNAGSSPAFGTVGV